MDARAALIWKMAEAAWGAHHCPTGAHGNLCEQCKESGECFELSGGFGEPEDRWDWYHAAKGALEALEADRGVKFAEGEVSHVDA
jgi:hypothetical protein